MAKCKVIHIGIFFDGTGNNKVNDSKKEAKSNIAKLSELYRKGLLKDFSDASCDHYGDSIYVHGVGTEDNKRDYAKDKTDKGAGGGGAKRINDTITTLHEWLKDSGDYPAVDPKTREGYRERIIDVFGFSRGAAMARDFINTFYKRNRKLFHLRKVSFNFVGLYDTVGSFGEAGNNINFKPKNTDSIEADYSKTPTILKPLIQASVSATDYLMQNAIESEARYVLSDKGASTNKNFEPYNFVLATNSAKKIVHIVASDEVRKNFPLSSLSNITSKDPTTGHQEWTYGGVHSDIGGGYAPYMKEVHQLKQTVHVKQDSNQEQINVKFAYDKAHSLATSFKNKHHDQVVNIRENTIQRYGIKKVTSYTVWSEKFDRAISNELTFVTLHRMYEQAIDAKVPLLKPISIPIPSSMKAYDSHTKDNPSSAMSFKGMPELRANYFHHSAVDQEDISTYYDGNTGIRATFIDDSPDGIGGNDTRYARTKSGKIIVEREIYPNKGRAIPPTKF